MYKLISSWPLSSFRLFAEADTENSNESFGQPIYTYIFSSFLLVWIAYQVSTPTPWDLSPTPHHEESFLKAHLLSRAMVMSQLKMLRVER